MGKSLVDDDTSRAVDTELGRVYCGRMPKKESGEKRLDVRKRMEPWNARVERVQRRTLGGGGRVVSLFLIMEGG